MKIVLDSNEVIARSMLNLSTFVSSDRIRQLIIDDTEKHRLDYLTVRH